MSACRTVAGFAAKWISSGLSVSRLRPNFFLGRWLVRWFPYHWLRGRGAPVVQTGMRSPSAQSSSSDFSATPERLDQAFNTFNGDVARWSMRKTNVTVGGEPCPKSIAMAKVLHRQLKISEGLGNPKEIQSFRSY